MIIRMNPDYGEIETMEVMMLSSRLEQRELLDLPVTAQLRMAAGEAGQLQRERLEGDQPGRAYHPGTGRRAAPDEGMGVWMLPKGG